MVSYLLGAKSQLSLGWGWKRGKRKKILLYALVRGFELKDLGRVDIIS